MSGHRQIRTADLTDDSLQGVCGKGMWFLK